MPVGRAVQRWVMKHDERVFAAVYIKLDSVRAGLKGLQHGGDRVFWRTSGSTAMSYA